MSYKKRPLPIGKKFGKLIILQEVPTIKGKRYVYCSCECGSKKVIRYDGLKIGRVKSCGCSLSFKNANQINKMVITRRKNKEKVMAEAYVGKKFNKLEVQSVYHHPKVKGTWFRAKCDCGKLLTVSLANLKREHVKSCGCIRRTKGQIKYISKIDGETIYVSRSKYQYNTTFKGGSVKAKEHLHIHEAKKAYRILGIPWSSEFVVHHVDLNKTNSEPKNLFVFDNNSSHRIHHAGMEKAMYDFLSNNGLLENFYACNPKLRLKTISELLITV
jgi:hypothetical protein